MLSAVKLWTWMCLVFFGIPFTFLYVKLYILVSLTECQQLLMGSSLFLFSQTIYRADRWAGSSVWCFTVWKYNVYIVRHSDICPSSSKGRMFSELFSNYAEEPPIRRRRMFFSSFINLKCPNNKKVAGLFHTTQEAMTLCSFLPAFKSGGT